MGRRELDDVTSQCLKMRPDIEKEIDSIVIGCGFRRVSLDETICANGNKCNTTSSVDVDDGSREVDKKDEVTTSWNREMHLYERLL